MLDRLNEQHAIDDGEAYGLLGGDGVERHIGPQIIVKPIEGIYPEELGRTPFIPDSTQQIAAPATDIEPPQAWGRLSCRESCLDDRVRRGASGGHLV